MQLRKGVAISSALQLVLVVLVGGTLMGVVAGPMMGQIDEGFSVLGEMTTSTTLNISDKRTFSHASLYVYHRASNDGCADSDDPHTKRPTVPLQIEGELSGPDIPDSGYPGLKGTFLGEEPPCVATDDAMGNDQEGKLSRVQFVVDPTLDNPIVLGDGNEWIDKKVRGARQVNYYDATREQCSRDFVESAIDGGSYGMVLGAVGSGGNPIITGTSTALGVVTGVGAEAITGNRFVGMGNKFVVYYPNEADDSRSDSWLKDASHDFSDRIYCFALKDQFASADWSDGDLLRDPLYKSYEDDFGGDVRIKLCPGDRGYIQMNKMKPQNDGEAGEKWGNAHNFPFIHVTEKGEC